jgi:hypothetical protein
LAGRREGESHRIMLEDSECEIVLRHEDVDRRSKEILDRYRVLATAGGRRSVAGNP